MNQLDHTITVYLVAQLLQWWAFLFLPNHIQCVRRSGYKIVTPPWYTVVMSSFWLASSCQKVGIGSFTDGYPVAHSFLLSGYTDAWWSFNSVLCYGWNQCHCIYFCATAYHDIVTTSYPLLHLDMRNVRLTWNIKIIFIYEYDWLYYSSVFPVCWLCPWPLGFTGCGNDCLLLHLLWTWHSQSL